MSNKNNNIWLGGMILGGAIGTIIGLLIAPRSGKETRKIVKKSAEALPELAEDISTSVQLQAGKFSYTAAQKWDETLNRLQVAIAAGLEASQQEAQKLTNEKKSQTITLEDD